MNHSMAILLRLALLSLLLALAKLGHTSNADHTNFSVVRVDPAKENLQLFWGDEKGQPFRRFDTLAAWLKENGGKGQRLTFAMNAGMYQADASAVGLLVMQGQQVSPLNMADGLGNFFLKPNGVFLLSPAGPQVVEASTYPQHAKGVQFATQSGPLLLQHGQIHPAFNPLSSSRFIRNGVGIAGKEALFVISEKPVTFYEFAVFFRDVLHCQDALYLDGAVSSLYSIKLNKNVQRSQLGPIIAVIE